MVFVIDINNLFNINTAGYLVFNKLPILMTMIKIKSLKYLVMLKTILENWIDILSILFKTVFNKILVNLKMTVQ